jgi:hypothetical protein
MSDGLTTPKPIGRLDRSDRKRLKKRASADNAPVLSAILVDPAG